MGADGANYCPAAFSFPAFEPTVSALLVDRFSAELKESFTLEVR